ncbi:MAG: hypothetical protein ACWGN7_06505 [Thermodesulfovibrionales bacterium]
MPHFGLMDEDSLGPVEGPLMRARLHIRGARRRLRQGKVSAGIVTLYDALLKAMEWFVADSGRLRKLDVRPDEDLRNDSTLFRVLRRSRILDAALDYEAFDSLVEKAANEDLPQGYDHSDLLRDIESVMTQLGVMPFDEGSLPPEDPSTF